MGTILQLSKSLLPPVENAGISGVEIRHYRDVTDIRHWIELRNRAFARETVGVRQWDEADFHREMLDKPWWSAKRFWFAVESTGEAAAQQISHPPAPERSERIVGAVVLADRGLAEQAQAAIHWLMVLPGWRRRGVARLLIAALEARAWELGHRHVVLETHAAWRSAVQFYERLGYQPMRHNDK